MLAAALSSSLFKRLFSARAGILFDVGSFVYNAFTEPIADTFSPGAIVKSTISGNGHKAGEVAHEFAVNAIKSSCKSPKVALLLGLKDIGDFFYNAYEGVSGQGLTNYYEAIIEGDKALKVFAPDGMVSASLVKAGATSGHVGHRTLQALANIGHIVGGLHGKVKLAPCTLALG